MGRAEEVEEAGESPPSVEPRRHRPMSEVRYADQTPSAAFEPVGHPLGLLAPAGATRRSASGAPHGALTDELRAALWEIVAASLFGAPEPPDRWTLHRHDRARTAADHPAVRRVWCAPPISGDLDRIPEDVADVLEGWFSLVEPSDVYAFLDAVHDAIDAAGQPRLVAAVNALLERAQSDHRFVLRKLTPIASRADVAAIERSLAACKSVHWRDVETSLLGALARLAHKPEPDTRGAIHEAIRSVEQAAFAVTGERHVDLDHALEDLAARRQLDRALKSAYAGLFVYVTSESRKTTTEDARLVLVICAGFVSHLAGKLPR